jgi:hypothetical protein
LSFGNAKALPLVAVGLKDQGNISAYRHQTGFEELGIPDGQDTITEIDVTPPQSQAFAGT